MHLLKSKNNVINNKNNVLKKSHKIANSYNLKTNKIVPYINLIALNNNNIGDSNTYFFLVLNSTIYLNSYDTETKKFNEVFQ